MIKDIKVSLLISQKVGMVHIVIKTDKFILAILKTIDLMGKESIFGLILIIIKGNSSIIRGMEKGHCI